MNIGSHKKIDAPAVNGSPFSSSSSLHPKKECKWNGPSCKHKSPCTYGQKNGQTCQRFLSRKKNRATEKPKLDNARRLREIYQTAPEDLELEECLEEGVKKIGIAYGVSYAMQVANVLRKKKRKDVKDISTRATMR